MTKFNESQMNNHVGLLHPTYIPSCYELLHWEELIYRELNQIGTCCILLCFAHQRLHGYQIKNKLF